MARYDRIARLDPPQRDRAFDGWLTLRDLEGREREPELGRRARLRFLALRPVRRLLLRGLRETDADSLNRQVESVKEELGQLPTRDPEREILTRYLEEIGGRSPGGLFRATLDVGRSAEAGGHSHAAEEFYRTALELAEAHDLDSRPEALRFLARLYRDRGEWETALECLEDATTLAGTTGDLVEWARGMDGVAAVHLRRGDPDAARAALDEVARRAGGEHEGLVRGIAAAGRCALELVVGDPEKVLEAGWRAISLMPPSDEARNAVLLNMAAAFRRLGLHEAAASCYRIVARWAAWPEHRAEARMEDAVVSAEAGRPEEFLERRRALLDDIHPLDRSFRALLDLGLGRGALIAGEERLARDHLREAISAARDLAADDLLQRSEALLTALEDGQDPALERPLDPSDESRRIAGRVQSLRERAVAGGGSPHRPTP